MNAIKPRLPKVMACALLATATIGLTSQAFAGYKKPSNFDGLKKVSFAPANSQSDIQAAMDNNPNGVIITLKKGTHTFTKGFQVAKNVHFRFEQNVTLKMTEAGTIFVLKEGNNSIVGPVKIIAPSAGYGTKFKAAGISCDNFLVKKLTIDNKYTTYCTMNTTLGAKNGTIASIKAINTPPGYGLVQVHAGENMIWKNLDCSGGGVALRFEQSYQKPWVGKISGRGSNITCRNGRIAVMIAPTVSNGALTLNKVRTYNCAWAVTAGSKYGAGSFSSVKIDDIVASYGMGGVFRRDPSYIPDSLQVHVSDVANSAGGDDGKFKKGPSHGSVSTIIPSYAFTNVSREGFPAIYDNDPLVVNDQDAIASQR